MPAGDWIKISNESRSVYRLGTCNRINNGDSIFPSAEMKRSLSRLKWKSNITDLDRSERSLFVHWELIICLTWFLMRLSSTVVERESIDRSRSLTRLPPHRSAMPSCPTYSLFAPPHHRILYSKSANLQLNIHYPSNRGRADTTRDKCYFLRYSWWNERPWAVYRIRCVHFERFYSTRNFHAIAIEENRDHRCITVNYTY